MRLIYKIEPNLIKEARIVVSRCVDENGKSTIKSLGSFSSVKLDYDHIMKQLTPEELYEFENYIQSINFSQKNFHCQVEKLSRFLIKTAPDFAQSLIEIWEKSKEFNIDFLPDKDMLAAAFENAKLAEQKLILYTDGNFSALQKRNIDISTLSLSDNLMRDEDQNLFLVAMRSFSSLDALTERFNFIASNKYNKNPIKAHNLEHLTKQVSERKESFRKWYYTIFIELLIENGVQIEKIIPLNVLTQHWLRLNKKENFKLTVASFEEQFPNFKNNPLCIQVIKAYFIDHEIIKLEHQGNPGILPFSKIKNWLQVWKKKYPASNYEEALKEFTDEFPLLASNPAVLEITLKAFD